METAPESFLCPIDNELMVDPVLIVETGHTYCRACIVQWFEKKNTCPNANIPVVDKTFVKNFALHMAIQEYKQKQTRLLAHNAAVVGDEHAELIAAQRKVRHLKNIAIARINDKIEREKNSRDVITQAVKALKLQSVKHQQAQKSLFDEKTRLERRINEINSKMEQCQTSLRKHELTLEEGAKRITTLEQKLECIKSATVDDEEEKEGEKEGKEGEEEENEEGKEEADHDEEEEENEEADEENEDDDDEEEEEEEFTPPSWKRSFKPSDGSQSTRCSPRVRSQHQNLYITPPDLGLSSSVSPPSNVRSSAGKRPTRTSDPNRTGSKDLTRKRHKIGNDRPNMYTPIDPNEPTYCVCLKVQSGQMIACENKRCRTPSEWYHFACVNLTHTPDNWFCPECSTADNHRS